MEMMPMPNMTMSPMSMKMTFHFGNHEYVLFDSWHITSDGELVGTIIAVFFMAFFYEGLKTLREYLVHLDVKKNMYTRKLQVDESTPLYSANTKVNSKLPTVTGARVRSYFMLYLQWLHLVQSALHVIQTGWGYLLMLIAMTYNGWLFLAVCFGAGLGYLVFARFRYMLSTAPDFREQTEPCH